MKSLLIDIETYSDEDLGKCGVYRYVESDSFCVLLFCYSVDYAPAVCVDLARGGAIPAEILNAIQDKEVVKIAHNAQFEITCLSKHFGKDLDASQWEDTMIWAARLGLPMSLASLGKVLKLEQQKLETGRSLIRYFSMPMKNGGRRQPSDNPEKWEQYKEYCLRDVDSEVEVAKKVLYKVDVPEWERELQLVDHAINKRGVALNDRLARNAVSFVSINKDELTEEAKFITGLDNPNSVSQLKYWIYSKTGDKLDSMDKKAMASINTRFWPKSVKRILEIRSELGKTSVAKYKAMLDCVCKDGRIHGLTQYCGASQTGRFAGRLVQTQNLPQNHNINLDYARELVLGNDYETLDMCYDSVVNILSELIRTAFVPSEGNIFHVCDFSAIEARVLAWLAGEQWVLDTFIQGGDIYCATASKMFGVPVEKHGQNAELRQKGKIATLALGYQGGIGALKAMGAERMGLKESEMKDIVKMWRGSNPNIVRLWDVAERAAKATIATKKPHTINRGVTYYMKHGILFAKLPSGRSIAYPRARLVNEDGRTNISHERMNQETHKWEESRTYSGRLVENLVQAIARDILGVVLIRAERKGLKTVFHVHDEIIVDVPTTRTLAEVEEIFGEPMEWCKELPLKGAGYSGNYYYKD